MLEFSSVTFRGQFCVVKIDHSKTPAENFSGLNTAYSLTVHIDNLIAHFQLVESTDRGPVLKALQAIGRKLRPPGCRVILAIDNMAHSGDTDLLRTMAHACGAEAVTQDLYHVTTSAHEGVLGTDPFFTSGEVRTFP